MSCSSWASKLAGPDDVGLQENVMLQSADAAGGPGGWLEQEIMKVYQQIRQAVYDDTLKLCDQTASGTLYRVLMNLKRR